MISVEIDQGTRAILELVEEWPKRTRWLARRLVEKAARATLKEIRKRVPRTSRDYQRSLEMVRVASGRDPVYAVRASPRHTRITEVDAPQTVIYIQSRRRMHRVSPVVEILERHSPWTVTTLPFAPSKEEARTITRKTSKREVKTVERTRQRDRPAWRRALRRAGVREVRKRTIQPAKDIRAVPDVAFEALRMEFGLGVDPHPHWRPALQRMVAKLPRWGRKADIVRYLTTPNLHQRVLRYRRISLKEAKKYQGFQKRLGLRARV